MPLFKLLKKLKESIEPKTMVTVKGISPRTRKRTLLKKRSKPSLLKSRLKKRTSVKKKPKIKSKKLIRKAKPKIKRKPKKRLVKKQVYAPSVREQFIGEVTHFFPHISVCVLTISKGNLKVADTIRILGATTDFKQKIKSMQINHVSIRTAMKGDEIGLAASKRVRINDKVYKIA